MGWYIFHKREGRCYLARASSCEAALHRANDLARDECEIREIGRFDKRHPPLHGEALMTLLRERVGYPTFVGTTAPIDGHPELPARGRTAKVDVGLRPCTRNPQSLGSAPDGA
jgi:hypothetical protein